MPAIPIDPEKDTICDVIRRWAEVQPDAPAIIEEDEAPLTYGALVAAMDEIRAALNSSGFGRGTRIAVVHSGGAGRQNGAADDQRGDRKHGTGKGRAEEIGLAI